MVYSEHTEAELTAPDDLFEAVLSLAEGLDEWGAWCAADFWVDVRQ